MRETRSKKQAQAGDTAQKQAMPKNRSQRVARQEEEGQKENIKSDNDVEVQEHKTLGGQARRKSKRGRRVEDSQAPAPAPAPRRSSRRYSSKSASGALCEIEKLPHEVLQVIGSHLSAVDFTTARLVNRNWARNITLAMDEVRMQLHPDADVAKYKAQLMFRLQPLAMNLTLIIGGRTDGARLSLEDAQANFDECIQSLTAFRHLRHLHLKFIVPGAPRVNNRSPVLGLKALTGLKGLQSLSITDTTTLPRQEDLLVLSKLTQLTKLVIYHNLPPNSPHLTSNRYNWQPTGIGALKSLRHLECPPQMICYGPDVIPQFPHPLAALTGLTKLVSLGSPLLMSTMTTLTALSSLQVLEVDPPVASPESLALDQPHLSSVRVVVDDQPSEGPEDTHLRKLDFYYSRLGQKATKLALRTVDLHRDSIQLLQGFTWLEGLDIESRGNTRVTEGFLHELAPLQQLRHFSYHKTERTSVPIPFPHSTFASLTRAWSNCLTSLDLDGINNCEFMAQGKNVLSNLRNLQQLESLSLKCSAYSMTMLQLNMEWLPPKLQSLQLRWFILTATKSPTHLSQMRRLSLERCTSSNLQHFQNVLEGLPGLNSLDLEDILDLSEQHIMHIRPLTQLTSLSVVAIGNHHITNSMLGLLTSLTGLRRLKWHAGDMLDSIPDPAFLKAFPDLFVLSLTTSMYYRMIRWSAFNVLDSLPYCQLETIGP